MPPGKKAHNRAMPYSVEGKLVVAISSRALFDFEEENRVFERDGEAAYIKLQFERLDTPARQGVAFPLVKKLLAFGPQRVEVVVLSKNDPVSGLRVFKSAEQAGLLRSDRLYASGDVPLGSSTEFTAWMVQQSTGADLPVERKGQIRPVRLELLPPLETAATEASPP